jgi:hypothetical protein
MALFAVNGRLFMSFLDFEIADKWRTILPILPVAFFMLVVIINLNSWSFYYFKIEEQAVSAQNYVEKSKQVKKYKTIVNYTSIIASSCVIIYTLAICIKGSKDNSNLFNNIAMVAGVMLIIVGFAFWIQGILINIRIMESFPDFYAENRTILWVVTLMLSVPILVRGGIDIGRVVDLDFKKKI